MIASQAATPDTADREIVVARVIAAPRPLVFDAFTDARHVSNWWGPRGFSTPTHAMDLRPGGRWRFTMHGPDGTDHENLVVYEEVVRPERLSYAHGEPGEPFVAHFHATITFVERDGGTEVTLRSVFPSAVALALAMAVGAVEGARQTLERLAEQLEGQ